MTRRQQAMTLPEVLVAGAVFVEMLTCVVLTLASYGRAAAQLMPPAGSPRRLALALGVLSRELSSLERLYAPDREALERGVPLESLRVSRQGVLTSYRCQGGRLEALRGERPAQVLGDADRVQVRLAGPPEAPRLVLELSGAGVPWRTAVAVPPEALP